MQGLTVEEEKKGEVAIDVSQRSKVDQKLFELGEIYKKNKGKIPKNVQGTFALTIIDIPKSKDSFRMINIYKHGLFTSYDKYI